MAELEVLVEYGVGLMATQLLEPTGMDALVYAGGERAALEKVIAE